MLSKKNLIIYFTLCLVNSVISDINGSTTHLLSFKVITAKHVNNKSTRWQSTRALDFKAFGKRFNVPLQAYYPLYYETKLITVINGGNESSLQIHKTENYTLYHGKVKNHRDSLAIGYFLNSGSFQGYIFTSQMYCIDSQHYKKGVSIVYQFSDVVPPGCQNEQGNDVECSRIENFQKWLDGISFTDSESNEMSNTSNFSSKFKPDDLSCGLKIVASPSLMEYFEENITDLVKDIYLQTEMLNILYRKITFRNKTKAFKTYFHIDSIIFPSKNFAERASENFSFKEFVKKHSNDHSTLFPACLIIGIDMTPLHNKTFFNSNENEEVCTYGKNTIILRRGDSEKPEPMALYLASYVRAITQALGATDNDKVCQTGSPPNPMLLIEKYFLSKRIEPSFSHGIFSSCNVREIEKSLSTKKCLLPFNYSTCGNQIREISEQCDCGPKGLCEETDRCCMPPRSMFPNETKLDSGTQQCVLFPEAECSAKEPCCKECKFANNGTKCRNESCKYDGICNGSSFSCPCLISEPHRSPCKGLECATIPCASAGLKPCLCKGKDECLVCCTYHNSCRTATRDLKLMGDTLLAFPDGSKCNDDGRCQDGKCIITDYSEPDCDRMERNPETHASRGASNVLFCYEVSFGYLLVIILSLAVGI